MNVSRRGFIGLGAAAAVLPSVSGAGDGEFDENLAVFLADVHVGPAVPYSFDRLVRSVGEILAMRPKPRNVIVFGDLAHLYGKAEDYAMSAPVLQRLKDAGIRVTVGMGNHDRRENFLKYHPDHAARTLVSGLVVTKTELPFCDILMLDGLEQNSPEGEFCRSDGHLSVEEQLWLRENLPRWKKPVFVCSHYPLSELSVSRQSLRALLQTSPAVAGYIYGHMHFWSTSVDVWKWNSSRMVRQLGLPSNGLWGDIGYVVFRTYSDRAVASLVQREFYFPSPDKVDEASRANFKAIVAERQNLTCTFNYVW